MSIQELISLYDNLSTKGVMNLTEKEKILFVQTKRAIDLHVKYQRLTNEIKIALKLSSSFDIDENGELNPIVLYNIIMGEKITLNDNDKINCTQVKDALVVYGCYHRLNQKISLSLVDVETYAFNHS